jgi:hypothetical protein
VTDYVVTATGGGRTKSVTISAADFAKRAYAEIAGLTDGTPYTVTVAARNAFGTSEPSLPAAPVTPGPKGSALPGAPTSGKALPSATAASIRWNPPAATGDTPVLGYVITVSDGRTIPVAGRDALVSQPTVKGMTRVVDDLEPATAYTFTVAAVTATGTGPAATFTATTAAA